MPAGAARCGPYLAWLKDTGAADSPVRGRLDALGAGVSANGIRKKQAPGFCRALVLRHVPQGEEICEGGMCQLVVLLQVLAELLQTGLQHLRIAEGAVAHADGLGHIK